MPYYIICIYIEGLNLADSHSFITKNDDILNTLYIYGDIFLNENQTYERSVWFTNGVRDIFGFDTVFQTF